MCYIAEHDGIKILAATPHFRPTVYENNQENILPAVERLQQEIDRKGISLIIVPGVGIIASTEVIPFLERNPRLTFGGRYALIEFPSQSIPPFTEEFFFRMRLNGITPLITHPRGMGRFRKTQGCWKG